MSLARLILDLGNVFFPLEFEAFEAWIRDDLGHVLDEVLPEFQIIYDLYERGGMTDDDFVQRSCQLLGPQADGETFVKLWNGIWHRNTEGMETWLMELKGNTTIHVLSNTNALHMDHFMATQPILKWVDRFFLSHEWKLSKPDVAWYEAVHKELNVDPSSILFFDDKIENIEGARLAGWRAEVFTDTPTAKRQWDEHCDGLP